MASIWWLYAHVFSVFLFLLIHGASVTIAFLLPRERDVARIRALLDASFMTVGLNHLATILVLATGITLASLNNLWSARWVWVSLILFIVMWGFMGVYGTRGQDKLRAAVGTRLFYPKKGAPNPPPASATPDELGKLLRHPRHYVLAVVGVAMLGIFLWLMMMKPF